MTNRHVAFLAVVLLTSCAADPVDEGAQTPAVSVTTTAVRQQAVRAEFEAGGTIRGRTTAIISSRVISTIADVPVRLGDRVRAGAVLVRLDARQLDAGRTRADASLSSVLETAKVVDADVAGAAAALTLARAEYERFEALRRANVATPAELDASTASLRSAEARASAAAARRTEITRTIEATRASARAATLDASYAVLAAPFDGIITERIAEPGALAVPGAPLIALEDVSRFRLEISIDAAEAALLATGARVPVAIAGMNAVEGAVEEVAAAADPRTHTYAVRIGLPSSPQLRSGLYGRARLHGAPEDRLVVPASAIVRRGQMTLAFVDDAGRARLRFVHPGPRAGDDVVILSGLSAGERVVINPPDNLADGARLLTSSADTPSRRTP